MSHVLLTVSGRLSPTINEDTAAGQRPRADYMLMAETFNADLLDYDRARPQAGWFGRLLEKLGGPNLMLAWVCFRLNPRYRVIFTDGEQVGIFLALFSKFLGWGRGRARHLMIVHILSVGKKMLFFDWLRVHSHIDTFFCYSTWQQQFIQQRWHIPPERVVFTPFMVDSHFFNPAALPNAPITNPPITTTPTICSVGLEFRDYPTLMDAVRGLDVHVIIAAGSPWSKRSDSTADQSIPPNVTVRRFSQHELRQVYADSRFVVMPLYNVNFQAGVTAILEGMAMGKAIICTRTPGQTDVVVEGETGLYVPPADPQALRDAITHLLTHPEEAEAMGRRGRELIHATMSLDQYVTRLKRYVEGNS
ncbi:MAG: glycosyltransferase family 4 protein [Chloroflexi bacterium]|nr:glycosyltransferase family 4 protein [Chloroflexota bacterium]